MKLAWTFRLSVFGFLWLLGLTAPALGQEAAGKWEGELNYQQFNGKFDAISYDWDLHKWNTKLTIYQVVVELQHVRGEKYTGTYSMNCQGCTAPSTFRFDAVLSDTALAGATEGLPVKGGNNPGYLEVTLREDNGQHYLEGLWKTTKAAPGWQGKIALRRTAGGPAKQPNDAHPANHETALEVDVPYHIIRSDKATHLRLTTNKQAILTDESGSEEETQWKFASAPGKYADYYRIIPASQDDHCLEVDADTGKVSVKPIEDKDSGEQYWAIEKKGDFYFLRCIGTKGTQVLDNDNAGADGHTIVRRKEDDDASQLWKLTKR
ncbi:MAG: RICIN domain-containing protein [Blastocatellia bacterium]|nr:RICIN domain-containing protein [Blastocatellia bacterium]